MKHIHKVAIVLKIDPYQPKMVVANIDVYANKQTDIPKSKKLAGAGLRFKLGGGRKGPCQA